MLGMHHMARPSLRVARLLQRDAWACGQTRGGARLRHGGCPHRSGRNLEARAERGGERLRVIPTEAGVSKRSFAPTLSPPSPSPSPSPLPSPSSSPRPTLSRLRTLALPPPRPTLALGRSTA